MSKGLGLNSIMAATNEFMHHLSMACCEWFLMFLMFIDAAFGFILTKFAHQCDLQSPCLFCWKFNHVFGTENLSLLCNKHRNNVSFMISCDLHDKLADVREMCDDCFMSIMKQKDEGTLGFRKPFLNRNLVRAPSSSTGLCSCCEKEWRPKPKGGVRPPVPRVVGPGRPRGRFRRRNDFKRVRDKISGNSTPCIVENNIGMNVDMDMDMDMDMDALSDSGCTDIRFYSNSDSDSDDSFYEVECGENGGSNDDVWVINDKCKLNPVQIRPKRSHSVSKLESSVLNGIITGRESLTPNHSIGHDAKENGIIPRRESLTSNGSIVHDVEENGPHNGIITGRESSTSDVKENGPHNGIITGRESLTSNSSIGHDVNENGPLEVSNETRGFNDCEHEGYESPESGNVSEIEGESDIEKLKRQVEHDHQRLRLLHKELEEERNAAAIAADEAMAMITRLQEEKAALHMEASQYLRMMDEQAEYDMEALDKANDLVTEKDKEIQDLEAELEYFRNRYEDELFPGNAKTAVKTDKFKANVNHAILELDDEKKYILQSLSDLESKFEQNGVSGHDELLELNERLEAVEADREFLEHACNTLQSHGGLEFVQDIAHHLHDLRKSRFDRRCHSVA